MMLDKLKGWKTYITALGGVCLGVYMLTQGNYQGAIETILAALGAASLRHAVTTETKKANQWTS